MALTAITIDRLQALQISLNVAAEIALDLGLVVRDCVNDLIDLLRRQFVGAQIRIDVGLLQNLPSRAETDSVNVGQRRFDAFIRWNFNS